VKVTGFTGDEAKEWIETEPPNNSVINLVTEGQTAGKYLHRLGWSGAQGRGGAMAWANGERQRLYEGS
jgi:hypothetical protein